MNNTIIAVIAFTVLLLAAGYSRAEDGVRIGVGKSFIGSDVTVGELGVEYNNWELTTTQFGQGWTKRGEQEAHAFYSASYLTKPQALQNKWASPFLRLGVSYNSGDPLVGKSNYRLGIGVDFSDVWRIEYGHYSSAGQHDPNSGVDWVALTYKMPFPF